MEETSYAAQVASIARSSRKLIADGKLDEAAEQLEELRRIAPDELVQKQLMADLRFAEQNWAEAAALYRAVLAAKPDARDAARRAHVADAMNHLALGGFDEAIEHATEAVRLDPEQAGRSVAQFCQKLFLSDARSQQISDFLDEVLQLAPEDPWLRRLKRQAPSANRMEARAPFLREIQHNGYVVKEVPGHPARC